MPLCGHDTLKTRKTLSVNGKDYDYFSLEAAGLGDISRLPYSLKVLLENLLRYEDGRSVSTDDAKAVVDWQKDRRSDREIAFRPARVLMQDFTGVPAVVDLAAMREAVVALGGDPKTINPLSPVDLVIDHSVMIDYFGAADSMKRNMDLEFERNGERYAFLRWGQKAFNNFRVVPPGVGICHQVNLEYLAKGVWTGREGDRTLAYPDTLVGTDSHTTMVNGLGVLGWGVGGIEAEAAMLGQPISMLIPEVIGFKLTGSLKEGTTATDLVLTVVEMLRKKGVVGKFVEFFGDGLDNLPLADRATIANMGPEYGATCGIFPIDAETLRYLRFTGRDEDSVALVEAYAKAQGMWRQTGSAEPLFTDTLALDMGTVEPSLAGPKRPQDRVALSAAAPAFKQALKTLAPEAPADRSIPVAGTDYTLNDGDVVIAAITSCTNTSNPSVLMAAGLVAKKAIERGLTSKPWVKTSLAPGSQVVSDYLNKAGLQTYLDQLGFNVAGYGCTTCIGNSGPLADGIIDAVDDNGLVVTAVLSGNRNFEGRISPQVKANYLASPPLVVAYAIAGSLKADITTAPLGKDAEGVEVFLRDIWPTAKEVADAISAFISPDMYRARYANVFDGPAEWQAVAVAEGETYAWDSRSTYVQHPPYFQGMDATPKPPQDILAARPLAILGDSVTTDHISPAGSIKATSPAGAYLSDHGVDQKDFNSYGARRGNHEVMMRGTFANIRIRNEMAPGTEGGVTKHQPSGEVMAIYDAAMKYAATATPLVILGGKEYGTGSSRDWAAKGTNLLGVKAVIVESFERIHRSNLVGMGVLPLQFKEGTDRKTLGFDGTETFEIRGVAALKPRQDVSVEVTRADGARLSFDALCRIDTLDELDYFRNGGILQYVLRNLASA
ncbi:aconitate hydratase 1 [Rhodospirillum rubrum]|uniref:aconitate hydratase AcnA n=1 Tax=Rhodospirillum rubrum TaxID=1085 RepID=UPI001906989A|nr:aconitate hydratase AcnA [Rhodospirillum rubrum]MBK1663075.1 aconitate hydratase 1 [Rhodospirillum rubrum]MBK1675770.1 aconitate hydratase 1 [Rhodospirillum rubrum]